MATITSFETALQFFTKAVDTYPILPLRQPIIGRRLLEVNPTIKGIGIRNVDVYTVQEMKDAVVSMSSPLPDMNRDRVNLKRDNLQVPCISNGFEISQDEILAYSNSDLKIIDIVNQSVTSAIYKINKAEDNLIINGFVPQGVIGLYNGAGQSYSTASSFATSGNAAKAITGAIALANAANVFPSAWNLVLNPSEFNKLTACTAANTNIPDLAWVKMILNPGSDLDEFLNPMFVLPGPQMQSEPGSFTPAIENGPRGGIYTTPAITPGTGLLLPVDPDRLFMQLVIPQDIMTDVGYDPKASKFSPYYCTIAERLLPHIKQPLALVQLTNIA